MPLHCDVVPDPCLVPRGSGLAAGQKVVSINGHSVSDVTLDKATAMLAYAKVGAPTALPPCTGFAVSPSPPPMHACVQGNGSRSIVVGTMPAAVAASVWASCSIHTAHCSLVAMGRGWPVSPTSMVSDPGT